jgi:phage terminase Nu1 subunit (DNA packaging protein)
MPKEVAALDEILLRLAANGASADEIERQTGIPAAQAVMHIKKILQSRDIWTDFERRQLLLRELNELKESMRQNALEMKDPQSARLLLQTLQTIAQRLDSEQKQLDVDIIKVTEHQAKVMGRAFDIALTHMKNELQKLYPEVSRQELDSMAQEGLIKAKYDLAAEK